MIRDGGTRFHEGIDIRPEKRDRRGEPADVVTAAMAGRVAYANPKADGAYGRYVVLEHTLAGVSLYTLYAHLASIDPALREGRFVAPGATLGVMGRSDAGGGFPKDRAHLHFEVGLAALGQFLPVVRRFGRSPGPEPPRQFQRHQPGRPEPAALLCWSPARRTALPPRPRSPAGCAGKRSPFSPTCRRGAAGNPSAKPALIVGDKPSAPPPGWRVGFTADGVPVRWEPLKVSPGALKIVSVDNEQSGEARRRGLVVLRKRNAYVPGPALETALAIAVEN